MSHSIDPGGSSAAPEASGQVSTSGVNADSISVSITPHLEHTNPPSMESIDPDVWHTDIATDTVAPPPSYDEYENFSTVPPIESGTTSNANVATEEPGPPPSYQEALHLSRDNLRAENESHGNQSTVSLIYYIFV